MVSMVEYAMPKDKELGRLGERLAGLFLTLKLYRIRERNYRTRAGELDMIAEKKGQIIFVEVKTRRSAEYGHPALALNSHKRQKIALMADSYLAKHGLFKRDCRFDVVLVDFSHGRFLPRFEHIIDAFSVERAGRARRTTVNKSMKS